MSMIGNFFRVTKAELDSYLIDSSLLENSLYNEDDDENPNLTDIDKAWHGIIFLLTGDASLENNDHPLFRILFSGQIIDEDQDLGYGPAQYLTPEEVADLNNQIAMITIADLKQNFDPKKLNELEVYPSFWEESDDEFNYLAGHFRTIQQIFSEATKNGEAIITFIN